MLRISGEGWAWKELTLGMIYPVNKLLLDLVNDLDFIYSGKLYNFDLIIMFAELKSSNDTYTEKLQSGKY